MITFWIFLITLPCSFSCAISTDPIVNTNYGVVYGWTYKSRDGTPVDIYQGIPFAKAPVGKLRFEKPQPPDRWFKPLITQKYADGCIPCLEVQRNKLGNVSEDCLYLNVWTPSNVEGLGQNASELLPVMVYIHGGGFTEGETFSQDHTSYANIYASRGIVVVTIQYRLAQLGFMTLNDTVLPANLGMWDQTMALQWVKENIEYFKGDPSKVTIWGESAGAMSVSLLTLAPLSRDLFQQSIAVSGSIFAAIGENKHVTEYTKQLIEELGCAKETDMKSCLQGKSVAEFQDAALRRNFCIADDINAFQFAPIQDGIFWPTNYTPLLTKEHAKPTMVGLNQKEGRLFSFYDCPSLIRIPFSLEKRDWEGYNETSFRQFLTDFVTVNGYSNDSELAFNDIYEFYTKNERENATVEFWLEQFVQVFSDFMFNVPVLRELVDKSAAGYPTFAFLLDHHNEETWPAENPVPGSTHVGEFPYVFEQRATFNYTEDDNAVKNTIQKAIIAFLKTGNPNTPEMRWNQFGSSMEYLSLQRNSVMKNDLFMYTLLVFLINTLHFFYGLHADPTVTIKYGTVVGRTYISRDGTPVDIYQGVPFAKPPVGKLRFEKPQPPDRWFQPLVAQKYADGCIACLPAQRNKLGNDSEDCLYLNVWTPSNQDLTEVGTPVKLPVMVYIHGGAFAFGETYSYDANKFADIYASRGIVVVTIQYRLAHLGFMTLNNDYLPANLGMWDQNMALRWIQENIEQFKGDPSKITIWGESAGAISVSQHTLSPYSRDLFQQSISVSGSTFGAIGSTNPNTIPYSLELIRELGCTPDANVKSCLQAKSVAQLQAAATKLNFCLAKDMISIALGPIPDEIFWPTNYTALVSKEYAKPTMMGLNQKEGRAFALYVDPTGGAYKPYEFPFALEKTWWNAYNENSFIRFLEVFVTSKGYGNETELALKTIFDYFTANKPANPTHMFWLEQFVLVVSDFMFNIPTIRELFAKTEAGYPTYAFLLDHYNQATWPASYPVQGSTHVGEFPYVFEMNDNFVHTPEDNAVKTTIQEGIIAFLKTGNPSTPATPWNQFGEVMQYLSLQQNSVMKNGFFWKDYFFWTRTMRKFGFDFINQVNW